jgi:hypothetical protein
MFDNIGGKIKSLASLIAILGIISSIASGFFLFIDGRFLVGILTAVLGSLASWIGSFMQYGFGQLIENSDYLVKVAKTTHSGHNAVQMSPGIAGTNSAGRAPSQQPASPWVCYSCGYTNRATAHCCAQCSTNKAWSEEKQKNRTSKT